MITKNDLVKARNPYRNGDSPPQVMLEFWEYHDDNAPLWYSTNIVFNDFELAKQYVNNFGEKEALLFLEIA